MPIDTANKKLALLEWDQDYEPGLPISPGALGQDDRQQLLWGYPGVLWTTAVAAAPVCVHGMDAALWTVVVSDVAVWSVSGADAARWRAIASDEVCCDC